MKDTKERILEVAEALFAREGLDAISLRSVTAEAGVNIASINYHFGSKNGLLAAMTQRFFTVVNTDQLQRLDLLEQGEREVTIEEILLAYARPLFALFDQPQGREWLRAWRSIQSSGGPSGSLQTRLEGEHGDLVMRRYLNALAGVLPGVPFEELAWRFERANNLLMANQGKYLMGNHASPRREFRDERAWLITFLAGGLRAPAT